MESHHHCRLRPQKKENVLKYIEATTKTVINTKFAEVFSFETEFKEPFER